MRTMRTIRVAWVVGNIAVLAAVLSPAAPGEQLVFICVAIPLLLLSWLGAVSRAKASDEKGWVRRLLILPPGIVMWFYICRHHDQPQMPPQPMPKVVIFPMADPEKYFRPGPTTETYPILSTREMLSELIGESTSKPLVLRQAIEAVEEAAKDYPDW